MRSRTHRSPRRAAARALALFALFAAAWPPALLASSHREAPGVVTEPEVDGADFYLFRSYEAGREGFVTLIADYNPMQDPFGGPTFFPLRQNAFYDISIDNDGDAVEDLTFRFRFNLASPFLFVPVPFPGNPPPPPPPVPVPVGVAITNVAPFGPGTPPPPPGGALNWFRTYTVRLVRGPLDNPTDVGFLRNAATQATRFAMPFDFIGTKSIPDYQGYAAQFLFDVEIPGCATPGRMFVGQRKDPFVMNLGEFFDLVNFNPLGSPAAAPNSLADKNVTSLALEVPISCLTGGGDAVIGGWTTASLPRDRRLLDDPTFEEPFVETGDYVQFSRLGNPMVNQISIALAQKNLFNASRPVDDDQFALYFTHPSVPVGIQLVGNVPPPTNIPRQDLVAFYREGLPGLNEDGSGGEMIRLNTSIAPVPAAQQNRLGFVGGDAAGFPNGRRPGDDVVDVTVRVLEGALCFLNLGNPPLCVPGDVPLGAPLPFTDQAWVDATLFDDAFPYLTTPVPGSPNPQRVFNADLTGTGAGACAGLLTPDEAQFSLTCTHDLPGAAAAELRQDGVAICAFAGDSPICTACALSAAQLLALQQGRTEVVVQSLGGGLTGTLD